MADEVYANGNEIACKAADGKAVACTPDVCMTPPENPATPPGVPVPYPNTGMASDTTNGSRTVLISGKEVMLKNISYFKTSYGNEAGCAAKKGAVTSVNKGKVYFVAWSMDVNFEGENVVRNLDMTTHNHASTVLNAGATVYASKISAATLSKTDEENCKKAAKKQREARQGLAPHKQEADPVTAGAYSNSLDQGFMASSNVARGAIRNQARYEDYEPGVRPRHAKKAPKTSNVECNGDPHEYRNSGSSPTGDAEAKILEGVFREFKKRGMKPSGKVYIKVDGLPVCCDCQKLMKCASESVKVVVCPRAEFDDCE